MADLPELGIVTLLNSMLDNLEVVKFQKREAGQGQEGRKIDRIPMGEYTVEEGMKRIWAAVEDEDSPTQPCVCGATVKCTASLKEEEEVHIIKETEEMSIRVANRELLDDEDIRRECAFTGCKFSDDKMCTTEKEYIEGQKWQGVDKGIGNSPDMEGTAPQSYTLDVNESYMLCTHGPGLIYFADAGQRYVNAFLDAAEFMVVPYGEPEETASLNYGIGYELNEDEKLFIAVIAGESIGEGELGWQVVANVIMNRVGSAEWARYQTPRAVIEMPNAFSCLKDGNDTEYKKCLEYLDNRIDDNGIYEQLILVVMPIYHGEAADITGGAQLYYSPKSMNPPGSEPPWASSYKQIVVEGIDSDDFVLFTGERIK